MVVFSIVPGDGKNCGPAYLCKGERGAVVKEIEQQGSVDQYQSYDSRDFGFEFGRKNHAS